jgi:hypothetical protein
MTTTNTNAGVLRLPSVKRPPRLFPLWLDLREEWSELSVNCDAGDFESLGGDPSRGGAHAAAARGGIDEPDGLDAHAEVVFAALLKIRVGIVG